MYNMNAFENLLVDNNKKTFNIQHFHSIRQLLTFNIQQL